MPEVDYPRVLVIVVDDNVPVISADVMFHWATGVDDAIPMIGVDVDVSMYSVDDVIRVTGIDDISVIAVYDIIPVFGVNDVIPVTGVVDDVSVMFQWCWRCHSCDCCC